MGVPQRQPQQRSLSSSTLSAAQRPVPPHRSVSQHHGPYQQSSSPTSRQQPQQQPPPQQPSDAASASAADPIAESSSPGTAAGRHGGANTPRRGGSRLRLELSSDHVLPAASQLSATGVADSPQSLPSARALSAIDGLDGGANSPALSRASHHDAPAENNPPIPMPDRRRIKASRRPASAAPAAPAPITPAASLQASVKKDGRPKPYTVEIPPEAPRLATSGRPSLIGADQFGKGYSSGHADFFPWTGKHREDDWSSESISKGIWERYSTTEASSARAAILPALKQKSGLSALSTIFMGVLNQRRQRGQVSAPSTFKPPPRVTLTDTKREIWLRDLANPATPLRRLSRTIPHGIRGRALLDQCLSKNVPTERAVWLAKCVGANEIRAFKRKGPSAGGSVGGDVRWIKDWTMFVEQFVDSVVSAPDESGWKAKVTYAYVSLPAPCSHMFVIGPVLTTQQHPPRYKSLLGAPRSPRSLPRLDHLGARDEQPGPTAHVDAHFSDLLARPAAFPQVWRPHRLGPPQPHAHGTF